MWPPHAQVAQQHAAVSALHQTLGSHPQQCMVHPSELYRMGQIFEPRLKISSVKPTTWVLIMSWTPSKMHLTTPEGLGMPRPQKTPGTKWLPALPVIDVLPLHGHA